MLMKEYRICMPLTVDEYRIGQLYMISKHSCEQSGGGEGVEVVRNESDIHPQYGPGQLTEKRIYLSSFTSCRSKVSFLPKFSIRIETRFENNNGDNGNVSMMEREREVFGDTPTPAENVSFLDILSDPIPEKHYKETEDLSRWQSSKTGRGPLEKGWRDDHKPIMCSYKRVQCSFEVYGFQTRTEDFIHKVIRDILLVGHRQAVAWIDEWHGLSLEEVRKYEQAMQEKTNSKVKSSQNNTATVVLTTTSRALRLFPSPRPAAYRQMHKEFNRVDLMREQRRTGEAVNAMDLFSSPPQPIGQTRCIDRGQ
ncbi:Cytoplasmic phosphatidylinositol transfer protein 1 [Collichthys lucidus]|uniref:Cytoplasmic phosphatidylinositol transfer protein 1 n=1 Tax=Collichthys lucidus TaxID=240159 RepID=A0A4U5V3J8_COLLU|nr:Cytoplasmic phosphatidylinositol transfer protein 1 [Collichthys lucidus]